MQRPDTTTPPTDAGSRLGRLLAAAGRSEVGGSSFAKPTDNVPLGILWMIGATVLLAVAAAIAKWQAEFYPIGEVMFVRSISGLVVCAALVLPVSGLAVFTTNLRSAAPTPGRNTSGPRRF
jgi:drug/metabolite transporter (DMT)-like permease